MDEIKKLIEEMGKAHKEYRDTNDSRIALLEKKGTNSSEHEEKLGKISAKLIELDGAKEAKEKELKARRPASIRSKWP
jgi:hypothetical protein